MVELQRAHVQRGEVTLQELLDAPQSWMDPLSWAATLRSVTVLGDDNRACALLARVGTAIADGDGRTRGIVPALLYHRLSVLEFAFAPDEVRDVIARPMRCPRPRFIALARSARSTTPTRRSRRCSADASQQTTVRSAPSWRDEASTPSYIS